MPYDVFLFLKHGIAYSIKLACQLAVSRFCIILYLNSYKNINLLNTIDKLVDSENNYWMYYYNTTRQLYRASIKPSVGSYKCFLHFLKVYMSNILVHQDLIFLYFDENLTPVGDISVVRQ